MLDPDYRGAFRRMELKARRDYPTILVAAWEGFTASCAEFGHRYPKIEGN
jgi:hypothetical protein